MYWLCSYFLLELLRDISTLLPKILFSWKHQDTTKFKLGQALQQCGDLTGRLQIIIWCQKAIHVIFEVVLSSLFTCVWLCEMLGEDKVYFLSIFDPLAAWRYFGTCHTATNSNKQSHKLYIIKWSFEMTTDDDDDEGNTIALLIEPLWESYSY